MVLMSYVPGGSMFQIFWNILTEAGVCFLFGVALSYEYRLKAVKLKRLGRLLQSLGLEDVEKRRKRRFYDFWNLPA